MLQFETPWAFALLPVPLLVFWLLPAFRDRGKAVRAPFFQRLVDLSGGTPTSGAIVVTKNWVQRLNIVVSWLLVVVALARPVWAGDPIVREVAARDMLLIVDLSGSMEAKDFTDATGARATRIDAVKQVLDEFITRRNGDRLGLAVFGDAAFPQTSFTDDHETVRVLLDELQPRMAGPKTMIGDAIGLAIKLFDASETPNKVVIMLTDGNDSGSRMPVGRAAEIAGEKGVTIHTIAMGDPKTVGEDELDIDALQQISKTTGGRFFLALDREQLDSIYRTLDRIEPQKIETLSYRPKNALFHYPLAALIVLNLLLAGAMMATTQWRAKAHG